MNDELHAHLDENDVLVRLDSRPGEHSIPVPVDCDLKPGDWRWNGSAFMPLPKTLRGKARNQVALELLATKAFALGLRALRDGAALPQYTLDWLAEWERTIDAGRVADGVEQDLSLDRRGGGQ